MPINLTTLNSHLNDIATQLNSELTPQKVQSQLNRSLTILNNAAIPLEDSVATINSENRAEFLTALQQESLTPRQWRHELIIDLQRLSNRLDRLHPKDADGLSAINDGHKGLSATIRWTCEQDVDPETAVPFRESKLGREQLNKAMENVSKEYGHDQRTMRMQMSESLKAVRDEYSETHINDQFPKNASAEYAVTLTERDALIIGKDMAVVQKGSIDDIAKTIASTLREGAKENRWVVGEYAYSAEYWEKAIAGNFEFNLPFYSELSASIRLRDQVSPGKVLETVSGKDIPRPFLFEKPTVCYIEDEDTDVLGYVSGLGRDGKNTVLVAPGKDGRPVFVSPWSLNASDYAMITAANKDYKTISIPPAMNSMERLALFASHADDLQQKIPISTVQEEIDTLHKRWVSLPLDDAEGLMYERQSIREDAEQVARKIVAPVFGGDKERKAIDSLVKLSLLTAHNGSERSRLVFGVPENLGTRSVDQSPSYEVVRSKNDDDTCNILWLHLEGEPGKGSDPYREIENVPNDLVTQAISEISHRNRETAGIKQAGMNGLAVYGTLHNGSPVFAGHWLNAEEERKLTNHSPVSLAAQNVMEGPSLTNTQASPDNVNANSERKVRDVIELLHGDNISAEATEKAYAIAAHTNTYELIAPDEENPARSTNIEINPLMLNIADDDEIRIAVAQKVACSEARDELKAHLIGRVQGAPKDEPTLDLDNLEDEDAGLSMNN